MSRRINFEDWTGERETSYSYSISPDGRLVMTTHHSYPGLAEFMDDFVESDSTYIGDEDDLDLSYDPDGTDDDTCSTIYSEGRIGREHDEMVYSQISTEIWILMHDRSNTALENFRSHVEYWESYLWENLPQPEPTFVLEDDWVVVDKGPPLVLCSPYTPLFDSYNPYSVLEDYGDRNLIFADAHAGIAFAPSSAPARFGNFKKSGRNKKQQDKKRSGKRTSKPKKKHNYDRSHKVMYEDPFTFCDGTGTGYVDSMETEIPPIHAFSEISHHNEYYIHIDVPKNFTMDHICNVSFRIFKYYSPGDVSKGGSYVETKKADDIFYHHVGASCSDSKIECFKDIIHVSARNNYWGVYEHRKYKLLFNIAPRSNDPNIPIPAVSCAGEPEEHSLSLEFIGSLNCLLDGLTDDQKGAGKAILKAIVLCGAIYTATTIQNRTFCIVSALLDYAEFPSFRELLNTMQSSPAPDLVTTDETKVLDADQCTSLEDKTPDLSVPMSILKGPLGDHMDTLVSCAVMCGLCEENLLTLGNFKIFATKFGEIPPGRDIVARVFQAVAFIGKLGYDIFEQRSFAPLFDLKSDLTSFSENVIAVKTSLDSYLQGNYSKIHDQDDSHYLVLVDKTTAQGRTIANTYASAHPATRQHIAAQLGYLATVRDRCKIAAFARKSRMAPYAICVFGGTGVGKSYTVTSTIRELLRYNGFPCAPENVAVITETDKFESTILSSTTAFILDDVSNTKAEVAKTNVAERIIKYINNIPATADKAAVEDKGKVLICPKIVMATTNRKDLDSTYWSNEPGSILRRFEVFITQYPRKDYRRPNGMLDSSKSLKDFSENVIHDSFIFDVQTYDPGAKEFVFIKFQDTSGAFPELHGKNMNGISYPALLSFLYEDSKRFYAAQAKIMDTMDNVDGRTRCALCDQLCGTCAHTRSHERPHQEPVPVTSTQRTESGGMGVIPKPKGSRPGRPSGNVEEADANSGLPSLYSLTIGAIMKPVYTSCMKGLSGTYAHFSPTLFDQYANTTFPLDIVNSCVDYHDRWYSWSRLMPGWLQDEVSKTWLGRKLVDFSISRSVHRQVDFFVKSYTCYAILNLVSPVQNIRLYGMNVPIGKRPGGWFSSCVQHILNISLGAVAVNYLYRKRLEQHLMAIRASDDAPTPMEAYCMQLVGEKRKVKSIFRYTLTAVAVASIGATMYAAYKSFFSEPVDARGKLDPSSDGELEVRSQETNPWTSFFKKSIPKTSKSVSQLINTIEANLCWIEIKDGNGCSGIWLRTDELMVPRHLLAPDGDPDGPIPKEFYFKYRRKDTDNGGAMKNWKKVLSSDVTKLTVDWVVIKTSACYGSVKDLTLPDKNGHSLFASLSDYKERDLVQAVRRESDGKVMVYDSSIQTFRHFNLAVHLLPKKEGNTKVISFDGMVLPTSDFPFEEGHCGTVVIDRSSKHPCIMGVVLYRTRACQQNVAVPLCKEHIEAYTSAVSPTLACSLSPLPSFVAGKELTVCDFPPAHSPTKYVEGDYATLGHYTGSDRYTTMLAKSKANTLVAPKCVETYSPPDFSKTRPFDNFLKDATQKSRFLDRAILKKCSEDYIRPIIDKVNAFPKIRDSTKPLENSEILNGKQGHKYVDRMNLQSAMGYPYSGKRTKHVVVVGYQGDVPIYDWKDSNVWKYWKTYEDQLKLGETLSHPFKSALKDEVRKSSKLIPRVFQCAPCFLQIGVRKYFLPLARILSLFPLLSECAVGINSASDEWEQLMSHIEQFGTDRMFAGDYKSWDTTFEKELAEAVYGCLLELAVACGYSDEDLTVMKALAGDLMNPIYALFGTYVRIPSTNPSGQNMTVYANSIGNSLKVRYMSFTIGGVFDFRKSVALTTYGDDMLTGVKEGCKLNFRTYSEKLSEHGITFTLPSKKKLDVLPEFLDADNLDFLKRKSVYIPELGYRVGALELESIWKSLLFYRKDSPETEAKIMQSTLESNSLELAYHGRKVYDECSPFLLEVAALYNASPTKLNETFDDKMSQVIKRNSTTPQITHSPGVLGKVLSLFSSPDDENQTQAHAPMPGHATIRHNKIIEEDNNQITVGSVDIWETETPSGETLLAYAHSGKDNGVVLTIDESTPTESTEVESGFDYTTHIGVTSDISLARFLERPILLFRETWSIEGNLSGTYAPFNAFISDDSIWDRIKNYAYMKGTMHIRIVTTGTSFHFGKAIAVMEPWPQVSTPETQRLTVLPYVVLDPNTATGGVLSMPLILPTNGFNLHITPPQVPMALHVKTINSLSVIGDTTTPLQVTAYMWMTDVEFIMPTIGSEDLIQADAMSEKLKSSKELPTSVVMKKVPPASRLTRYLRASEAIIKYGIEVAALLGMSRPNGFRDEMNMRPSQTGNLTHTNVSDSSVKLTLDSKQEVFVDGLVAGVGDQDQMDFNFIVQKEMLVYSFIWNSIQPTDRPMARWAVTPCIATRIKDTAQYMMTPSCHVANAFKYWRGTMIYRIEVVATPFHRGKLRVIFDPFWDFRNGIGMEQTNIPYSHIIDLSETRSYEFCVGWGSNLNFLDCTSFDVPWIDDFDGQTDFLDRGGSYNGIVTLTQQSPLTVGILNPGSTKSSAFINIYARMSDDSVFCEPTDKFMNDAVLYRIPPRDAGPGLIDADAFSQLVSNPGGNEEALESGKTICLNEVPEFHDSGELTGIHFGERCTSIRPLIKRYSLVDYIVVTLPTGIDKNYTLNVCTASLPLWRRYTDVSPNNASPQGAFRFAKNHYVNWFLTAYMGYRGGARWKFSASGDGILTTNWQEITNSSRSSYSFQNTTNWVGGNSANIKLAALFAQSSAYPSGGHFVSPKLNPTLEVEIPYYSKYRFKVLRNVDITNPSFPRDENPGYFDYRINYDGTARGGPVNTIVSKFYAAADDFSMIYYKFPPVVERTSDPIPT